MILVVASEMFRKDGRVGRWMGARAMPSIVSILLRRFDFCE